MAVNIWFFCLLSLGCCRLSVQENPVTVELSCGPGPAHVVLEPANPLLLDCHVGAAEVPRNVTWLRDGAVLGESEAVRLLPNGSLLVLPADRDWKTPVRVEGDYRCLSGSSFGALTSRTVTLQLASLSRFLQDPESQVVPAGDTARFQCHVDGLPVPGITWEKDQVPLPVPAESDDSTRCVTLAIAHEVAPSPCGHHTVPTLRITLAAEVAPNTFNTDLEFIHVCRAGSS